MSTKLVAFDFAHARVFTAEAPAEALDFLVSSKSGGLVPVQMAYINSKADLAAVLPPELAAAFQGGDVKGAFDAGAKLGQDLAERMNAAELSPTAATIDAAATAAAALPALANTPAQVAAGAAVLPAADTGEPWAVRDHTKPGQPFVFTSADKTECRLWILEALAAGAESTEYTLVDRRA